jgi:hypothetical protein
MMLPTTKKLCFGLPVSMLVLLAVHAQAVPLSGPDRNDQILAAAKSCLGKKMWSGYGLRVGTLGCAAALSNVLKQGGVAQGRSATVVVLRRQLLAVPSAREIIVKRIAEPLNIQRLKECSKPGDVLLAFMEPPTKLNGGPNAHCGIMGDKATVYTNDWNDGIWKNDQYEKYFYYYKDVRLIRFDGAEAKTSKRQKSLM